MTNMTDSLQQYVSSRNALLQEREEITARLADINAALDHANPVAPAKPAAPQPQPQPQPSKMRTSGRNPMPLRVAILQVTSTQALSKKEIVSAVEKIGYHFETKNPVNSLNHVLYGDSPTFKVVNGKYSPVNAGSVAKGPKASIAPKTKPAFKAPVTSAKRARVGKY